MDFIQYDQYLHEWYAVLIVPVLAFLFIALVFPHKPWAKITAFTLVGAIFLSAVLMFRASIVEGNETNARDEKIKSQISERYELDLSDSDLSKLNYPKVKEAKDFAYYGSIQQMKPTENGAVAHEYSLLWKDGKMVIVESEDGKNFKNIGPEDSNSADSKD